MKGFLVGYGIFLVLDPGVQDESQSDPFLPYQLTQPQQATHQLAEGPEEPCGWRSCQAGRSIKENRVSLEPLASPTQLPHLTTRGCHPSLFTTKMVSANLTCWAP